MARDIRIEEVENGYVLRAWEVNEAAGMIHSEPMKESVATSRGQVLELLNKWFDKKPLKLDEK